jgi:hypothetical protein
MIMQHTSSHGCVCITQTGTTLHGISNLTGTHRDEVFNFYLGTAPSRLVDTKLVHDPLAAKEERYGHHHHDANMPGLRPDVRAEDAVLILLARSFPVSNAVPNAARCTSTHTLRCRLFTKNVGYIHLELMVVLRNTAQHKVDLA